MELGDILREELIEVDLRATDKWQAIRELIDVLVFNHEISMHERATVLATVVERERSITTGVGEGVAIPHGAVDDARQFAAAIGISRSGVEFDAVDGQPVHIVVLLIVPKRTFGRHVRTLASIARLLHVPAFRDQLRAAPDGAAVLQLIRAAETTGDVNHSSAAPSAEA